jgi:hypothetical protein
MTKTQDGANGSMAAQILDLSKSSHSNGYGLFYSRHWHFELFRISAHFKAGPLAYDFRSSLKFQYCKLVLERS